MRPAKALSRSRLFNVDVQDALFCKARLNGLRADQVTFARSDLACVRDLGQRVWYDEFSIKLGDDLSSFIEYAHSRRCLASSSSARRFSGGVGPRMFVVPHGVDVDELAAFRPEMANRLTMSTDAGAADIAGALVTSIRSPRPHDHASRRRAQFPGPSEIKIPPLLDRDGRVRVDNAIEGASPNVDERRL